MKKKILNKVLNIVVTLMAAIALMLGNVTSVAAYTDLNGYPFVFSNMSYQIQHMNGTYIYDSFGTKNSDHSYTWAMDDSYTEFDDVYCLYFGNYDENLIFPYDADKYDYYIVGTYGTVCNSPDDFTFSPDTVHWISYDSDMVYGARSCEDIYFYNYSNYNTLGFSFSFKVNFDGSNSTLSYLRFRDDSGGSIGGSAIFSASIVPVLKDSTDEHLLSSILQTLNSINQNLITNNTLQQSTIDAINQNTTNTSNWFTTLITTMQGWYNTQTENLRTWFYMIEERMSAGFTALYHQMTKEQDEKLNGYDDTTQSDAADNFNTESDKLTQLEDQLNDQSHGFVSDYTTTGFNTGVLTTLSSSLIFVTTWFANFWNMGGIFTAGLNLCFSLSIVFFILRLRR